MAEVSKSSGVGKPSSNMFYLTFVEGVEGSGEFALRFPEAEKLQFLFLSPQKGMSPLKTVPCWQICHWSLLSDLMVFQFSGSPFLPQGIWWQLQDGLCQFLKNFGVNPVPGDNLEVVTFFIQPFPPLHFLLFLPALTAVAICYSKHWNNEALNIPWLSPVNSCCPRNWPHFVLFVQALLRFQPEESL